MQFQPHHPANTPPVTLHPHHSSEPVAATLHKRHRRQRRWLIAGIIAAAVLLVASIAALIWWERSDFKKPGVLLQEALQVRDTEAQQFTVNSQLGFSLIYDSEFIDGHGQVTTSAKDGIIEGLEYSDGDLAEPRSYNIVTLRIKKDEASDSTFGLSARPTLTVLTSARQQYFEPRRERYPGLSDTEIAVREFNLEFSTLVGREQETINNIPYEKLLYESRTTDGTQVTSQTLQYVTVQHGRPFVINILYSPSTQQGDLAPLIAALESVTYRSPDAGAQYLTSATFEDVNGATKTPMVAGLSTFAAVPTSSNILNEPKELAADTALKVVAKNQLAVVRVGTIYCFDVDARKGDGSLGLALPNVCGAGVGSGSILDADGWVATNGHVATIDVREALGTYLELQVGFKKNAALKQLVDYFVAIGATKAAESGAFLKDLETGKAEALEAARGIFQKMPDAQLGIRAERGEYAIQLAGDPVKLVIDQQTEKFSFNYGKTIVKAALVDSEVDRGVKQIRNGKSTDVALLDIESDRRFPTIAIGNMGKVKKGDGVTIVGFPGFVDDHLLTKRTRTIPTATQGKVTSLATNAGGYSLLFTSAMAAQGNSGGPAFNDTGEQVGLITYVTTSAVNPDIGSTEFAKESIIHNIADLTAMATDNKVELNPQSDIAEEWHAAIDAFAAGDYRTALREFKGVQQAYGDHYLVDSFITATSAQLNTGGQRNLIIGAILLSACLLAAAIVTLVLVIRRHGRHSMPPGTHPFIGAPPTMPSSPSSF